MSKVLDPYLQDDFSRGRITKYTVSPLLAPKNSVSNAINVDFSEIIGSAIVRKGNTAKQTLAYNAKTGESQESFDTSTDVYDATWLAQTFTVQSGATTHLAVLLSGKKTGSPDDLIIEIRNTVAGSPGPTILGTMTVPASEVGTSFGQVVGILMPVEFLIAGTVYSLVISSPGSPDVGNSYQIRMNSAGGYAGGGAFSSSNSGSTWAPYVGQDLFFVNFVQDTSGTYFEQPLGFQAGRVNSTDYGVAVFTTEYVSRVVLFYYNSSSGWLVSSLQNLPANQINRFAVLKGAIFRVSTGRTMDYSIDQGATWAKGTANGITITENSVVPNLVWVSKNRMVASGYSAFPSRVYFSSIVDPNAANFITWDTDPDTGDWIDINPDDGGNITGFSDTSNLLLVFKNNAMYRLNTINKTVDSENIFNIGAVSQEAIVKCLGLTYFFSGNGIYRTDGGFPELISRIGVQDFIDNSIEPSKVTAGTDGFNVYFSLGNVTVKIDDEQKITYNRVVLKFSPRDENWSVFTYSKRLGIFSQYRPGERDTEFWDAQYNGDVGYINYQGTDNQDNTDYGEAIPYSLESQEMDMGSRATTKVISDKVVAFTKAGTEGSFQIQGNGKNSKPVNMQLNDRVNVGSSVNLEGQYFIFKWLGEAKGARPILQGLYLPTVTDQGITKND